MLYDIGTARKRWHLLTQYLHTQAHSSRSTPPGRRSRRRCGLERSVRVVWMMVVIRYTADGRAPRLLLHKFAILNNGGHAQRVAGLRRPLCKVDLIFARRAARRRRRRRRTSAGAGAEPPTC